MATYKINNKFYIYKNMKYEEITNFTTNCIDISYKYYQDNGIYFKNKFVLRNGKITKIGQNDICIHEIDAKFIVENIRNDWLNYSNKLIEMIGKDNMQVLIRLYQSIIFDTEKIYIISNNIVFSKILYQLFTSLSEFRKFNKDNILKSHKNCDKPKLIIGEICNEKDVRIYRLLSEKDNIFVINNLDKDITKKTHTLTNHTYIIDKYNGANHTFDMEKLNSVMFTAVYLSGKPQ